MTSAAKPIRVVHVASGREWRGGQRQVYLLACGMHASGCADVQVVTSAGSELATRLADSGVPVTGVPWDAGLDPRAAIRIAALVNPGVIVHAHDAHAHALVDVATRLRGGATIATRRIDIAIGHTARWRRVRGAIALSAAVAERLGAAGVPPDRVHIIPPAVEPPPPDANGEARSADSVIRVVCIAALTPEKGVDVLIDAMPILCGRFPALQVAVLGDGSEREALQARIDATGCGHAITLAGHIGHPERFLDDATLAVQPSRSEGFGSSVLDAIARGVPVVASDTGGLRDALLRGGGVLVPPGDPIELARAIAALVDDPAERRRLGDAGRSAARHFTVDRLVSRTLDVYRSP